MYRETLANQAKMNEINKQTYGKMTYQEKKLNRNDLHRYKEKNNNLTAMIPGLNHTETVGSNKPL